LPTPPLLLKKVRTGQHVGGDRPWQILVFEDDAVQLPDRAAADRVTIEGAIAIPAFLVQNPFVLGARQAAAGAGSYPDPAVKPDRRSIGRPYSNDSHGRAFKNPPLDCQRRWRDDFAIGLDVGKGQ
jgi:hypothetical protein